MLILTDSKLFLIFGQFFSLDKNLNKNSLISSKLIFTDFMVN